MAYTTVTFGGETLNVERMSKVRVPGTIKHKVGGSLTEVRVPGLTGKDVNIDIDGVIYGTNRDALRTNLTNLDDGNAYPYSDGITTGSFIIPEGGLSFRDEANRNVSHYEYTLRLVEWRQ